MEDLSIIDLLEKCETYTTNVSDTEKYLYRLSKFRNEKRIDILKTVISVMQRYKNEHKVQSRGMVCVRNFFRLIKINDKVDLDLLREMVDVQITVLESHPDDIYLVNSILHTMANKRILSDVDFDKCRCFEIVMDYLDNHSIQLYAAWCLHGICEYNPNVNYKILANKNKLEILEKLQKDKNVHFHVRSLCHEICSGHLINRDGSITSFDTEDDVDIFELLDKYEENTTNVDDTEIYLYRLSKFCAKKRIDIIKVVIPLMRRYQNESKVQLRSMVCLKKLVGQIKIEDLGPDTIKEILDAVIAVLELHSDDDYLCKSALQILCNHKVLNDFDFDRCRCLSVVVEYFVKSHNLKNNNLALNVCFALSYEIVMNESLTFNFPPKYQAKLLSMIRLNLKSNPAAPYALGTLANLITDNLSACENLEDSDMELFIKMLDIFHGKSIVETQLLRILYNVLEVGLFRLELIQRPLFISKISQLLNSEDFSVSFYAAGVMAYLLVAMPTRPELQDQLHRVINNWPTDEVVMFRSLKPLHSLLQSTDVHPVQLYSAWCINLACTNDPKSYCKMLKNENELQILKKLEKDEATQPDVRNLCLKISKMYLSD